MYGTPVFSPKKKRKKKLRKYSIVIRNTTQKLDTGNFFTEINYISS